MKRFLSALSSVGLSVAISSGVIACNDNTEKPISIYIGEGVEQGYLIKDLYVSTVEYWNVVDRGSNCNPIIGLGNRNYAMTYLGGSNDKLDGTTYISLPADYVYDKLVKYLGTDTYNSHIEN
jgi:hypothetical protein